MGNSVLEFESVGGHGCNREAKVGEEVLGCGKQGCPDCEAQRAVKQMLLSGVGTFYRARFVHWPGTPDEVVDEFEFIDPDGNIIKNTNPMLYAKPGTRLRVTRRKQDFFRNKESA